MKPKSCTVVNFGSYRAETFDFSDLGLTLVGGPTGSGKSTLADFVPWICWGVTSKEGAADDVRSWGADEPTVGTLEVELPDGAIEITRIRGKPSQNDLYWIEASDPERQIRGKDASDTQKLLNARLGVDAETFILSSYFAQFSKADQFFFAKAKDRRDTLEKIADLTTAVKLGERASEARKGTKKELEEKETNQAKRTGRLEQLQSQKASSVMSRDIWEEQQTKLIAETERKAESFEAEKTQKAASIIAKMEELDSLIEDDAKFEEALAGIEKKRAELAATKLKYQMLLPKVSDLKSKLATAEKDKAKQEKLPDVCPSCNRPGANPKREEHLAECDSAIKQLKSELSKKSAELTSYEQELKLETELNSLQSGIQRERMENERLVNQLAAQGSALEALDAQKNVYADRLEQLKGAENPYTAQVEQANAAILALDKEIANGLQEIEKLSHRIVSLTQVYDLSFALRGELLQNAVSELEQETNLRIENYFDGAFRVAFALDGSDKLEVEIFKDAYLVPFRSLSGGQRRILTLCFSTALMRMAANKAGIDFGLRIFDEACNGFDDELKVRAFRLFQDLSSETGSIILIDHSEALKSLFDNRFDVELDGDCSVIRQGESSDQGGVDQEVA